MKHCEFFLAKLPEKPSVTSNIEQMRTSLFTWLCVAAKSDNQQKTSKSPVTNGIEISCSQFQSGDTFF